MSISSEKFGEEYFERGIETGKSLYADYHWLPDQTLPMAHYLIMHMGLRPGDAVLDYGCAKGFVVKALRMLGIEAYGCDISKYAIDNADPEVKMYCLHMRDSEDPEPFTRHWDAIIAKDVLEHMNETQLSNFLRRSQVTSRCFYVIPLAGENGKYIAPEYELDSTHIIRKSELWWIDHFEATGWKLKTFAYYLPGIKDKWVRKYPKGNGFFLLEK